MLKPIEGAIEWSIFASRWLLAPLYLGLIVGQVCFSITFFEGMWHLIHGVTTGLPDAAGAIRRLNEREVIALILTLLDMIMVANLVIMVLIGGYATFVSKLNLDGERDRPEWLDHIDPGTLKTKLAGALVSISGIHLLQSFTVLYFDKAGTETLSDGTVQRLAWQVGIHVAFIATTLLLSWSDLVFERKVKAARENAHDKATH